MASGTASNEHIYYESTRVRVTSKRVMIGSTTYALGNITSVRVEKQPGSKASAIVAGMVGLAGLLWAFTDTSRVLCFLLGPAALAAAAILWYKNKDMFVLKIRSAAGEKAALSHEDREPVQEVADAINEAMAG
jgi:hypothetical protein